MQALTFEEITHRFGSTVALRDFSLSLNPGEVVCLLGPSGCGKTTALRVAAGLERLQHGRILIGDETVADQRTDVPPERRSVGLVFQDYALFPHLTVFENVSFGLSDLSGGARRARAWRALEQVGMEALAGAYPHMLSGGQQQRIALARALAPRPRVMLLDEPFSGLDARLRHQVRDDTLHILKEHGSTSLIVTHDPEEAMFMADRIALMQSGTLEQVGEPSTLYLQPVTAFVASFFGEINKLEGIVEKGAVSTPFGMIDAGGLPEGVRAQILIRPEALRLTAADGAEVPGEGTAIVMASRMLGRSSLVHLCPVGEEAEELHLHARIPGRFLPREDEVLKVHLDRSQTFVFPLKDAT